MVPRYFKDLAVEIVSSLIDNREPLFPTRDIPTSRRIALKKSLLLGELETLDYVK